MELQNLFGIVILLRNDYLVTTQRKRTAQKNIIDKWLIFFLESKVADLSAAFHDISPNTLKKDLQYLRDE